jgi:hypothetical protein
MALETLKNVTNIGGFNLIDMNAIKERKPEMFRPDGSMIYHLFDTEIRPFNFIYVRHDVNSISFTLQNGPIKEVGVNGCQVVTILETAMAILEGLNKKFPCEENVETLRHLRQAIGTQHARTKNRESRGVGGTSGA